MANFENILFLFLGWLLGLLSPIIAEEVKNRRTKALVRLAILSELREVRLKLVFLVFLVESRFGSYNRDLLNWFRPIVQEYRGPHSTQDIINMIEQHIALTDDQLRATAQHFRTLRSEGLSLKKYYTPLIESRLHDLTFFEKDFQNQVLEFQTRLNLLNEEVDEARFYFEKT